jgi:hypothetical protein
MVAHACARGRRPDGAAHTRAPFKYVGPARLCKTQQRCYHRPPMGGGVTCRGGTPLKPSGRPDSHRIATATCTVARVVRGWRAAARGRARRRGAVAYAACGDGARSHAAVRGTWRPVASAAGRGHGARPPRRLGECTDEGGRGVGSRIADAPSGSRTHVTTIVDAEHTHTWLAMAGGTTTHS